VHCPCAGRVRGYPGQVQPAGAVPGEYQHVQPVEKRCLRRREVAGDDRMSLGCQELPPGRPSPPGRRTGARGVQDLPYRRRRDRIAGPGQLTLDPPVPPGPDSPAPAEESGS
jgi:hypothetical protein